MAARQCAYSPARLRRHNS
uniref:Uncharacterized protein n=1 Tax=Arundo donax TaxID=35708 RepID=A0A0A9CD74_ARUDO